MKVTDLLCSTAFMMTFALVISFITNFQGLFPSDILNKDVRSNMTILFLAIMLTVTLSRIPMANLDPIKNYKSVLRAIFLGLIIAGLIPLVAFFILRDLPDYANYAPGLVFIAATPFAASVGPLSLILRGNLEHALRSTIIVYVVSLLWIPFIVWLTIGQIVDMNTVIITVIELIGVPLVLSRLFTKFEIDKTIMGVVLNCTIAFLVWLSVSSTTFPTNNLTILVVFLLIAAFRDIGLGITSEIVEKRMGIHWSTRVTDILMISYKNKGIAIALCTSAGPAIGNAMVAISASIVAEVLWVVFMDSYLFSKKRMERELALEQ